MALPLSGSFTYLTCSAWESFSIFRKEGVLSLIHILAQEVVENELMKGTAAYRDGRIVYLAHPAVWYTAEGGITALDRMLRDLEDPLLK